MTAVPLLLGHREQHPVAEDAGVVDEDVETAEGVDRLLDEARGAVPAADVVGVGRGLAARGRDLVDDLLRRSRVGARTVTTAAEVVDHDLGAVASEGQRVLASQPTARTRDDADPPFTHAVRAHAFVVSRVGLVPESIAQSTWTNPGAGRGCRCRGTSRLTPSTPNSWRGSKTFVREECEPLDLIIEESHDLERPGASGAHPAAPADRQGTRALGDPPRAASRRAGLRAGEARPAERDPRTVGVRADRLRLAGTRLRQQRDPGPLRHPRAQGAVPGAAARQPHRVVLLDDRTPGRRGPEGVHHRRGAGR